jgi:uncharacterized protein with HEPN domain
MSRDPRVYLEDVLESIRRINTYVTGLDEERLASDELRLDAVIRNLEVIGEAVKQLPEEIKQQLSVEAGRRECGGRRASQSCHARTESTQLPG